MTEETVTPSGVPQQILTLQCVIKDLSKELRIKELELEIEYLKNGYEVEDECDCYRRDTCTYCS